jgi:hypothetical protein
MSSFKITFSVNLFLQVCIFVQYVLAFLGGISFTGLALRGLTNYLGYQAGNERSLDLEKKLHRFNSLCRTIKHTLLNETQEQTLMKFFKVLQYHLFSMRVNVGL